jgi:hypothetical protein
MAYKNFTLVVPLTDNSSETMKLPHRMLSSFLKSPTTLTAREPNGLPLPKKPGDASSWHPGGMVVCMEENEHRFFPVPGNLKFAQALAQRGIQL